MRRSRAMVAAGALAAVSAACQQPAHEPSTPGGGLKAKPEPGLGPADMVPAAALAPDACADAPLLTLEQVARGEKSGERIAFDAVPRAQIFCTLLACIGPSGEHDPNSCCNQCGGGYQVEIREQFFLQFHGLGGGCGGYDCNVHCEPFGRSPAHAYRFVGVSEWSKRLDNGAIYDKSKFTVEKFCTTPETPPSPTAVR